MRKSYERRALQWAIACFGIIPLGAGLAGAFLGISMVEHRMGDVSLDSHFRYLSGLLFAIGIGFYTCIPHIETKTMRIRLLTAIVFTGGLARLFGILSAAEPSLPMMGGLVMELVVTPLLCLWQGRISYSAR